MIKMSSFSEKIKLISIAFLFFVIPGVHSDYIYTNTSIHCQEFGQTNKIEVKLFQNVANFTCSLYNEKNIVSSQTLTNKFPKILKLTAYNSTWEKKYTFMSSQDATTWTVLLLESDFFKEVSDFDLFPKPSIFYTDINLKWFLKVEFCHPLLSRCLYQKMILVHKNTDILFNTKWGNQTILSQLEVKNLQLSSTNIISTHQPCQPGSMLTIYSKPNDEIYFLAFWNAPQFKTWFKFDCSLTNLPSCVNLVIYDAVLTGRKLLLATSKGLLSSKQISLPCFEHKCMVYFYSINITYHDLNWKTASFSFSPICAKLDYILNKGDVVLLNVENTQRHKLVFKSFEPYLYWKITLKSTNVTENNIISTTFDRQTLSLITMYGNNGQFKAKNDFLSTISASWKSSLKYPSFLFSTIFQENVTVHQILLSNHYFFVAILSDIWLSIDGGNTFVRIYTFSANENVMQLTGYEPTKSVACLTSNDKVWIYNQNSKNMVELQPKQTLSDVVVLFYDHIGNLFASSGGGAIGFNKHNYAEICSLAMKPQLPHAVQFLQLKSIFNFSVFLHKMLAEKNFFFSVAFGNPSLLKARVKNLNQLSNPTVFIEIESQFMLQGISSITVSFTSKFCGTITYELLIIVGQEQKRLTFDYSSLLLKNSKLDIVDYVSNDVNATNNLLQELPVNYQPPSSIAVAIPQSSNIYNIQPNLLNNSRKYSFAEMYNLKEICKVDNPGEKCSCSSAQEFSSLETYTDCRKRVYKVVCNHAYNIELSIIDNYITLQQNTDKKPVVDMRDYFVYLEEVNGRDETVYTASNGESYDDFCLKFPNLLVCKAYLSQNSGNTNSSILNFLTRGKSKNIYNASMLSIKFLGSGLFHFRVTMVQGFTFCVLQDEFQAYATNPPLPFPTGTIIRLTVSFLMGLVLIVIYMKFLSLQKIPESQPMTQTQKGSLASPNRRNMSYVSETDIKVLRTKLRSSFAS